MSECEFGQCSKCGADLGPYPVIRCSRGCRTGLPLPPEVAAVIAAARLAVENAFFNCYDTNEIHELNDALAAYDGKATQ